MKSVLLHLGQFELGTVEGLQAVAEVLNLQHAMRPAMPQFSSFFVNFNFRLTVCAFACGILRGLADRPIEDTRWIFSLN